MLSTFQPYKYLFSNLLMWLMLGMVLGTLAVPVIALHFCYLYNKYYVIDIFLGFFFVLILSDSRLSGLIFAKTLKIFLMVLLFLPLILKKTTKVKLFTFASLHTPFLPFFFIAFLCIIYSPLPFNAFQKTLSYLLLLIIVPIMFFSLYKVYNTYFLKAVVFIGVVVLVAGYVMYFFNPSLVMYGGGGRSSGALGNPNGLGMFSFLFFMLYFTIQHYFPHLFSKRENLFILFLILGSLLWSGSRGQTSSVLIFWVTQYVFKRNRAGGLFVAATVGLMFLTIEIDIVAIAQTLGFADYLRIETLDAGGGRVVAREFAWEQIQKNFWIGKGFSFTDYIYYQNFWELSMRGHEGNAHNSYLTIWLDTGFIGLLLFLFGWATLFYKAAKNSFLAFPVAFAVLASTMVESWLVASLNPFTIQLLMVLTLLIYIVKDAPASTRKAGGEMDSELTPAVPAATAVR